MKGNFRKLLRKFCLDGSVLGLKYFYIYPDWLTRCFWGVVMSLNLCLACLLTWLLYNRFAEMPTRITIENQYEPAWNLPHPAVTICSPNQMTISAMKHFNKTLMTSVALVTALVMYRRQLLSLGGLCASLTGPTSVFITDGRGPHQSMNLERTLPHLLGFYQLIDHLDIDGLVSLQKLMARNRYTAIEVMETMSQGCDNFFKMCYFHGRQIPCTELFNPILTIHGMCCIFNSVYRFNKRNEKVKDFQPHLIYTTGITEALTVVVDYEPMNAVDRTVLNAGSIRVMVTDWTEFPADDESRVVPPHTESFHMMHATYTYCSNDVRTLPTQSRKCYFEDEQSLPYFGSYHNSDCDLLCFVSEVESRCQCSMIYMPYLKPEEACNVTKIACIIETKMQMSKWYRSKQCDCPRDCESRRYRLDLTVGNLDALHYIVTNPYENVTFTESTSILHLFFPNSVHVKQKQETVMSLINLVSNLGGVFGLCLGCSYISIFEILFFIYVAVRNHLRDRLRSAVLHTVHYNN